MNEAAVSLAFFDPVRRISGVARAGLALLYEGTEPSALPELPEIAADGDGWRLRAARSLEASFDPVGPEARLAGAGVRVCRVRGTVGGTQVDCLGTATTTSTPPAWAELDAVRSLTALFDEDYAVLVSARRPRGATGHEHELVSAALIAGGELLGVEDARLSTVYDGEGRQRSASLELWLPGEDFPRRVFGEVAAGTSLLFEGLRVNAAVFGWRGEGREGAGAYDVWVREPEAAA